MPSKTAFFLTRCSFLLCPRLAPFLLCPRLAPIISTWGDENCLCVEVSKSHGIATSILWGVASGFSVFGKMPPDTLFCSLFLPPPHGEGGGLLGQSGCFWLGGPKARIKLRWAFKPCKPFICYHYCFCILRPNFSGWVGCFVSLFWRFWKITKKLWPSWLCFRWCRGWDGFGRAGLEGPTSLNTSFFLSSFLAFLCWSI